MLYLALTEKQAFAVDIINKQAACFRAVCTPTEWRELVLARYCDKDGSLYRAVPVCPDAKFWQAPAFVAWVQQRENATAYLQAICDAAAAGNMREYQNLLVGCPVEIRARAWCDFAPAWYKSGLSRATNHHWRWKELGDY